MNGGTTRADGRQEHYHQCKRDSPGHEWEVVRTVATPSMCSISIVWRKGDGDDLDALYTDS
jgi:hypothetical protein